MDLIEDINSVKNLNLTKEEKTAFALGSSVGIPFSQLKSFLGASPDQQKAMIASAPGIPSDTAVLAPENELATWIRSARETNPKVRICIKADGDVPYMDVNKIIKTLAGYKIFKFNLITNLKAVPQGTAAWNDAHATEKKS